MMEVLLGMLGPLAVAGGSWVLAEWTYRRSPERLTLVMVAAFGGKMIFFGAYVVVVLALLPARPVPFVVSFTASFVGSHLVEALLLRHLLAGGPR